MVNPLWIKTWRFNPIHKLFFKPHIDNVVSRCAQTFYALRVLKSAGLCVCGVMLCEMWQMLFWSATSCMSHLRGGDLPTDVSDGQRLQSIINKAVKQGFLSPAQASLTDICQLADETLFSSILRNRNNVFLCLLPPVQQSGYTLRPRAHDRSRLPDDVFPLLRQNFIYRSLSNNFFYSN